VSRPANQARQQAQKRGRRGEALAVWWLRFKGYRILARDLRLPGGEIDILARRGRVLAVVEVKRRGDAITAAEALGQRQQGRIVRAAEQFLARRPDCAGLDLRFDVVLLSPARRPRHIEDAWRPGAGMA
jgi:putative endonuclease